MPIQTGQILNNRYRIVSLLGQGGFGAVYRAWDINMERPRALKENLDISPDAQRQFKRESQILDTLTHPNLPKVLDHFIIPGQGQYLVMEFIEGEDLQEKINKSETPLLESQVIPWILQICDALHYLHSQTPPIIHRDIKPANIKVTPQGQAVLVDFGIAKVYDPVLRTTVGARAITPGYSPPEQYGQGKTDPRTDIYALGSTMYTLLTRKTPPDSVDIMTGRQPHPEPVSRVNPEVSTKVESVVVRAMQLNEKKRYESIAAMKMDLTGESLQLLSTPGGQLTSTQLVQTTPRPSLAPSPKKKKKPKWLPGVVVVGVLAIVFVVYLALTPGQGGLVFPFIGPDSRQSGKPIPITIQTEVSPADAMVMAYVPAGEFDMGSETGYANEEPIHSKFVPEFWIDQTEITNGLYARCMEAEVCRSPRDMEYISNPSLTDHPVIYVSWEDAMVYCEWVGRRLPTEAMWEKAARGGLIGKSYPWGDQDPVCQPGEINGTFMAGCSEGPGPVKTFRHNAYGLYDMAGNVWEWVVDWYSPYPGGDRDADVNYGERFKVARGGSFYDDAWDIKVSTRHWVLPGDRVDNIGFRCALY